MNKNAVVVKCTVAEFHSYLNVIGLAFSSGTTGLHYYNRAFVTLWALGLTEKSLLNQRYPSFNRPSPSAKPYLSARTSVSR